MTKAYSFEKLSAICGIVGCLGMLACVWIAMVPYVGMYGESYSTANHFISELGDRRYSELQAVFNFGLMGSSSLLVVFGLGFARHFSGWNRVVNSLLGVVTGVSCFLVGFFPEDLLRIHLLVAMIFFHSALVLVFLNTAFTLFAKQPVLPKWTAALGFLTALAFAAFVISPSDLLRTWIASPKTFIRPQVWIQPILEWACFYSILLWILTVAVLILLGKIKGSKV
ncbi:MAG: DUF998 domain-containing protein [Bacteroidetes bacterium]|nr:DUF998 domain-containing protein [Bacteroidota bacterium]